MDERYVVALIGCVLSGSANPSDQSNPQVAKLLRGSPKLTSRIADQQICTPGTGQDTVWWKPEAGRVERVLVKNARGHVLFESALPISQAPNSVSFRAIATMTDDEYQDFDGTDVGGSAGANLFPEVGSRGLTRVATSEDLVDGWVEVQSGVYRYRVSHFDSETVVRTVIREYLATEVIWGSD
jgi:hypothetical protein